MIVNQFKRVTPNHQHLSAGWWGGLVGAPDRDAMLAQHSERVVSEAEASAPGQACAVEVVREGASNGEAVLGDPTRFLCSLAATGRLYVYVYRHRQPNACVRIYRDATLSLREG